MFEAFVDGIKVTDYNFSQDYERLFELVDNGHAIIIGTLYKPNGCEVGNISSVYHPVAYKDNTLNIYHTGYMHCRTKEDFLKICEKSNIIFLDIA